VRAVVVAVVGIVAIWVVGKQIGALHRWWVQIDRGDVGDRAGIVPGSWSRLWSMQDLRSSWWRRPTPRLP
jgi:hypothetical protein